jgi:hypothetical protein
LPAAPTPAPHVLWLADWLSAAEFVRPLATAAELFGCDELPAVAAAGCVPTATPEGVPGTGESAAETVMPPAATSSPEAAIASVNILPRRIETSSEFVGYAPTKH